jgi:hypothetical protein
VAEAATYREWEGTRGATLALDAGLGGQRLAPFGRAAAGWEPVGRLWAQLGVPLAPGRSLRVEVDAYDGGAGQVGAAAGRWRWVSGSAGARWAF